MFNRKLTYRAPLKGCQKSHVQSDQLLVQCSKMSLQNTTSKVLYNLSKGFA